MGAHCCSSRDPSKDGLQPATALQGTQAGVAALICSRAQRAGSLLGENVAASTFLHEWVGKLPVNMTADKQKAVVATLEAEVQKLESNVKKIQKLQADEKAHHADHQAMLRGNKLSEKDKQMMQKMDQWSDKMDQKAKIGATMVMSKLKNAIHLIKKGALGGNAEAAANLQTLMKQMGMMAR